METPNQRCSACASEWMEPPLSEGDFAELQDLLLREKRISFVRRLREITGIGLASAKAILDHTDFHIGHCHACDAPIERGFRVICGRCGAVGYSWHALASMPPAGDS